MSISDLRQNLDFIVIVVLAIYGVHLLMKASGKSGGLRAVK